VKSLSDAAFFRAFDAVMDAANPGLKRKTWEFGGASWRRDRYSLSNSDYAFVIEIFTVLYSRRPSWKLLVCREHLWDEEDGVPVRTARWTRLLKGGRSDALAWFRKHETVAGPV
jgi:hypothetical protein